MRLGSWTTLDTPLKQKAEALKFLEDEFGKIEGEVFERINQHDLGEYPSFEIDYPYGKFNDLDEDDESPENLDLLNAKDDWQDKANEIETRYNEKFEKYL